MHLKNEGRLREYDKDLLPWLILFFIEILLLYSGASMNQRPFSPITGEPFKVQNYYFQLILLKLIPKRTPTPSKPTYTFTPFKGTQKYQSSKPIQLQLGGKDAYPLEKAVLNFVAISYNPSKSLTFAIRMIENGANIDKEIGEYLLDANNYIDTFTQTENGAFTLKVQFNDDWAAEAELYVERSRYGVERLVRDVKNPKVQEKGEAVPISHQAIKEQRRQLDLKDEQEGEETHHANRFKKFSPRRESQEDILKKNQHFNRKTESPPKKENPAEPKKEERKSPKAQFVPKKEWMIPQAEKYIASKTKTTSRSNSIHQKPSSIIKEEEQKPRRRPAKPVEQPSLMEKLPIQPKYIVVVAILIAIALAATFFFQSDSPPQDLLKAPKQPKQPKPKKIAEKPAKPQKGVKIKK